MAALTTFMVFKGTDCCALECELNKAEAVSEGRHCTWAGVMGYDATLNGVLVSCGGKVERKLSFHAPSLQSTEADEAKAAAPSLPSNTIQD